MVVITSPEIHKFQRIKCRRAKETAAMRWLKELTCNLVYGEKYADEGPRPSITKEGLQSRWNYKNHRHMIRKLANYQYEDHFGSDQTYYFMGNGRKNAARTLVKIDIDVQKAGGLGTTAGAIKFAKYLKSRWSNLYYEPSTSGQGIHCYFVLAKKHVPAEQVNRALKRLEKWLRNQAELTHADIELVEVKGSCLDLDFLDGTTYVNTIKYGSLAKLPREIHRFDELRATTVLTWEHLTSKEFDVKVAPPPRAGFEKLDYRTPQIKLATGSTSGKLITEEDLAAIPHLAKMAGGWLGGQNLRCNSGVVATPEDVAIALVLLRYFFETPQSDGALPKRRAEGLWNALYQSGDIDRAWNHHRWKAIRDWLSQKGHIDWTDHRYQPGYVTATGEYVRGTAMRWQLNEDLVQEVSDVINLNNRGGSSGESQLLEQGPFEHRMPKLHPFRQQREQDWWERAEERLELVFAA